MAAQQTTAAAAGSSPSAQVVGNAFVQQYYHILHQTPALVHRFYQESSKLGRPEDHGTMISVTSMQAINEKILSMDFHGAEIKTVDAQDSLNGGVLVLVTGYVTGKDNVRRDFTQSFFLAPQDKGFFVLNDIFRYVGEAEHQQGSQGLANGAGAPLSPEQDSPPQQEQHVPEHNVPPPEEEEEANEEEVSNPSDNGEGSVVEEEAPVGEVVDEAPNSSQAVVVDAASATIQEEAPKKSYASIVKVMKDSAAAFSAPTSASARPAPAKPERQAAPAPMPATAPDTPAVSSSAGEGSGVQEAEADGHSIYVKSLPLSATPEQLEEEFKRFGHIKPGGIQVRSHKLQGFCFGFVEFEEASAVQSAIAASPVMIGSRQVFVEEKRTNGSRVNNRGRFGPGRGVGFRNDGMRGRGSYGGGRGYGRGDFSNRPDFGGRGGSRGRGGDVGYQRVDYMGSNGGRGSRPGSSAVGSTKH